jgi:hypothetical protein
MKYLIFLILFTSGNAQLGHLITTGQGDQNITVTQITDTTENLGELQIIKENLGECIHGTGYIDTFQPIITSEVTFAKGINGTQENGWIRQYLAIIEIPVVIKQKELIVIGVKSPTAKEPIYKEIDKKFNQIKTIHSNPKNGDSFAGRSKRFYFFSSPEKAIEDAKKQASSWLMSIQPVACSK